jgi:hypothetical protein
MEQEEGNPLNYEGGSEDYNDGEDLRDSDGDVGMDGDPETRSKTAPVSAPQETPSAGIEDNVSHL